MRKLIIWGALTSLNVLGWYYFILFIMWLCDVNLGKILSLQPYILWPSAILIVGAIFAIFFHNDDF